MTGEILIIESAAENGSTAIARDGRLVAEVTFSSRNPLTGTRTEALAPAVASVLQLAGVSAAQLGAIVCDTGPGGFTSLRSAAALAKGICSVTGAPLYVVSSLAVLAWSAAQTSGRYVVALSAGRNEWFAADVEVDGAAVTLGRQKVIGDDALRRGAAANGVKLIGASLDIDIPASAAAVIPHLQEVEATGPVSLDSWEPDYGRLAEAQVKWEAVHGRPLPV